MSDSIRIQVLQLYDMSYKLYRKFEGYYVKSIEHTKKAVNPGLFKSTQHLDVSRPFMRAMMEPIDGDLVKGNVDFRHWLLTNTNNNELLINIGMNIALSEIEKLIGMIERYLANE